MHNKTEPVPQERLDVLSKRCVLLLFGISITAAVASLAISVLLIAGVFQVPGADIQQKSTTFIKAQQAPPQALSQVRFQQNCTVYQATPGSSAYSHVKVCTGPRGPTGYPGIQGETGNKGAMGHPGPRGVQGARGDRGLVGQKGDRGNIGHPGAQGLQGYQGQRGFLGPKGELGLRGPKGEYGAMGYKGERGFPGPKGTSYNIYQG